MKKLSTALLEKALLEAEDCEANGKFVTVAPLGTDAALFEKFLRILKATSPDEVADVTDDELLDILDEGYGFFNQMHFDSNFDASLFAELSKLKSVHTANRRVL